MCSDQGSPYVMLSICTHGTHHIAPPAKLHSSLILQLAETCRNFSTLSIWESILRKKFVDDDLPFRLSSNLLVLMKQKQNKN